MSSLFKIEVCKSEMIQDFCKVTRKFAKIKNGRYYDIEVLKMQFCKDTSSFAKVKIGENYNRKR